jgi:hypothetical protein
MKFKFKDIPDRLLTCNNVTTPVDNTIWYDITSPAIFGVVQGQAETSTVWNAEIAWWNPIANDMGALTNVWSGFDGFYFQIDENWIRANLQISYIPSDIKLRFTTHPWNPADSLGSLNRIYPQIPSVNVGTYLFPVSQILVIPFIMDVLKPYSYINIGTGYDNTLMGKIEINYPLNSYP